MSKNYCANSGVVIHSTKNDDDRYLVYCFGSKRCWSHIRKWHANKQEFIQYILLEGWRKWNGLWVCDKCFKKVTSMSIEQQKLIEKWHNKYENEERIVSPFNCGSQSVEWESTNCSQCRLGYSEKIGFRCEIEYNIGLAGAYDGKVTYPVAKRMGYDSNVTKYTWRCTEFKKALVET